MALWYSKITAEHEKVPGIRFTGKGQDMAEAIHKLRIDILAFVSEYGDRDELRTMISVFKRDRGTLEKLEGAGFQVDIINKAKKGVKTYG